MKKIGIRYSNDNTATWSTAVSLDCLEVTVWENVETKVEQATATKRKWEDSATYLAMKITLDYKQFDPAESDAATANALWKAVFDWLKGKTRRIYNNDLVCAPTFTGYDDFNVPSNSVFMILDKMTVKVEPFEIEGDTHYHRFIELELSARDVV